MRVVATAGHVDHGKSTLVLALTGMDPDRLAEEKARGLTVDLGFAWTTLPSGEDLAFVDVPGHARFIKNMLAGVGMVGACLFVVDATEGWKPQSEEHLRILDLVGLSQGVIALTKVGLVDDGWRARARAGVRARVAGTFLAGAPIVEVDAPRGIGLDDLRAALGALPPAPPPEPGRDRPRLWIDRAFAIRGSGTVVTGTLTGGALRTGDRLTVVPGDRAVRVRGLESLKRRRDEVGAGARVAVNLTGAGPALLERGHALVREGQWRPTQVVDASLEVLASLDHEVSRRGSYACYVGSGEHRVGLRVLGAGALAPGERGCVRLRLPVPLPLVTGDRYVLREDGRWETVGGGVILDVAPVRPASAARPTGDVDHMLAERGWVDVDDLEATTGERRPPTVGRWVVAPDALAATTTAVRDGVRAAGQPGLEVARLDERQRAVLSTLDDLTVDLGRARGRRALTRPTVGQRYLAALEAAPFEPPAPEGLEPDELGQLVRQGWVVERQGVHLAASAVEGALAVVTALLEAHPEGFIEPAVAGSLRPPALKAGEPTWCSDTPSARNVTSLPPTVVEGGSTLTHIHRMRPDVVVLDVARAPREADVIDLVARGLTNKEIAAGLGMGVATVKTHVHHVLVKLRLKRRSDLVALVYDLHRDAVPPAHPEVHPMVDGRRAAKARQWRRSRGPGSPPHPLDRGSVNGPSTR